MRWVVLFPCVLVACDIAVKFDDVLVDQDNVPGEPGDETTEPGDDDDDDGDGPVRILSWKVSCDNNTEEIWAETEGRASMARFYQQETGNSASPALWSENHTLEPSDPDADGLGTKLERRLRDSSTLSDPINDWREDESTLFHCEWHIEFEGVMSYAIAVYDADGALADCVAFGEDPQGLVDGIYPYFDGPDYFNEPAFDLSLCYVM